MRCRHEARDHGALKLLNAGQLDGPVLITGGAGFVGANLADRLLTRGVPVIVMDSLARPGVERNLVWLRQRHRDRLHVVVGDVRDGRTVAAAAAQARAVFHFASQVAVTCSVDDPVHDFEVNVRGTLNVLEALRRMARPPRLVFTSTNKVYGALDDLPLVERGSRYEPVDLQLRVHGIGEDRPLDFRSPYGCSKGAADQYVLDYARTYGLETLVLRMSCIYGLRQCGNEDQGWIAHFLIRALQEAPITLFGDGRQVRDVLFIEDLLDALEAGYEAGACLAGQAFNIGGGAANAVSLLEVVDAIADIRGERPALRFEDWRAGDQRYYVADNRRFMRATGWRPRVSPRDGITRLHDWLIAERKAPTTVRRVAQEMV